MKRLLLITLISIITIVVYYSKPHKEIGPDQKIDYLKVVKSKRKMYAYFKDSLIQTYTISLGDQPFGHKAYQGDEKPPEGTYTIFNRNPNSGYYKNLGISYPNDADKAQAFQIGKDAGGDIKIHGLPNK